MSDPQTLRRIDALERALSALQTREYTPLTGTWTPTLVGSGTAGTFTYGAGNGGDYQRVGNWVHFAGRIFITATSVAPTGSLAIGGLPIAAAATVGSVIAGGANIFNWNGFNVAAGYTQVDGQILTGESDIGIIKNGDNLAPAYVQGSEAATTIDLQFWGAYRVA